MSPPYRYARAGFLIESDWALPNLTAARRFAAPFGHLSIRRGIVGADLPSGVAVDSMTQAGPGGLLLNHPVAGRFLARFGREIIVDPVADDLGDLRPFVLSSGFAAICIQRSLVVLHASAVAIGDRAVAFVGPRGAGKSTVLGAFVAAGHAAINDDLSLIEARAEPPARIWAAPGYLRLWPDSVQALGLGGRVAGRELSGSAKLQLLPDTTASDGPWPLSAICLLVESETDMPSMEPMETTAAIACLAGQLFRPQYIHALGQLPALIPQIGHIAAGTPLFSISRRACYRQLPDTLEMVERTVHTLPMRQLRRLQFNEIS